VTGGPVLLGLDFQRWFNVGTDAGHARDRQMEMQLFADPQLPLHQQLEAYEHKGGWVNRMILGDSLVVMNSLLEYEGLGGQVQTIYIDPPYGVKFGSNFQPFVRKRDVSHNDDDDLSRATATGCSRNGTPSESRCCPSCALAARRQASGAPWGLMTV